MDNKPTSPDEENGTESPLLSVRLTLEWKWALRQIAKRHGYRTLSDYIYDLLRKHTDVETVALQYPKSHPGTLENNA